MFGILILQQKCCCESVKTKMDLKIKDWLGNNNYAVLCIMPVFHPAAEVLVEKNNYRVIINECPKVNVSQAYKKKLKNISMPSK